MGVSPGVSHRFRTAQCAETQKNTINSQKITFYKVRLSCCLENA